MPDISTITLFLLACLALNATPGPDMLLIATRSAAQGRLAGLATYLGIATGAYVHAAALAFGLSQLFVAAPMAYDILRFLGSGYLLFLAYQAFCHRPQTDPQSKPANRHSTWALYRQGMLTNVLNPKVALFFLALFPQFLDIERGAVGLQIIVLATILNLSGLIVNGIVILIAASARSALSQNQRIRQVAQYFTGLVFTALAARLVFDTKG